VLAAILLAAMTYTNPVWDQNFPDPFILQHGDDFYAYATQRGPAGFQMMTSKNLVDWTHLGGVNLPDWANGQLWAPEVWQWRGKWYMFFSARDKTSRKRDLAVSVADHPKGPYKFLTKLILGTEENPGTDDNGAIDPTLHVERGKPYLLYIREAPPRAVKIVELSRDLTKIQGEKKVLLTVTRPIEQGILDAPTLVKKDGAYWLFYSSGWFQSFKKDANYRVWAARSKSLMGPYAKPEKPVLMGREGETYSPGHQCVFRLRSGEWWMAYHAWNAEGEPRYGQNPKGRTLRLDRLAWTPDGPSCPGPTLSPQPAPKIR
jgi:beta-xylosidase